LKKIVQIIFCILISILISNTFASAETTPNLVPPVSMNFMVLDQGNYRLSWSIKGDTISIQATAKTTGWVAIGFEPTEKMKDADMIIGFINPSGISKVIDAFSVGLKGPHPDDISLGGTDDLLTSSVSINDGWTSLRFERKFVTGDKFDKDILQKPMKVIWSYGSNADIKNYHETSRGSLEINFINTSATLEPDKTIKTEPQKQPAKKPIDYKIFLWIHILLMSFTLLSMLIAISMIYGFKKKTGWFTVHKSLLYVTTLTFIGGFISSIFLVNFLGSKHFRGPHKIIGLLAFILSLCFLSLSIEHQWKQNLRKVLRPAHIWTARIIITLFVINLFLGILLAKSFLGF
jgi:hypothetical protein